MNEYLVILQSGDDEWSFRVQASSKEDATAKGYEALSASGVKIPAKDVKVKEVSTPSTGESTIKQILDGKSPREIYSQE